MCDNGYYTYEVAVRFATGCSNDMSYTERDIFVIRAGEFPEEQHFTAHARKIVFHQMLNEMFHKTLHEIMFYLCMECLKKMFIEVFHGMFYEIFYLIVHGMFYYNVYRSVLRNVL